MTPDRAEEAPVPEIPRQEPLPDTRPKPPEDDPEAPARLERLLNSVAYRRADQDQELLQRDELRDSRLALEYLKVELSLEEHEIRSTIVLFGGTRVVEPAEAQRAMHEWQARHLATPDDPQVARKVAVAKRVLQKSKYYDMARSLARLVSESCCGHPRDFVITTGGGPGIMEAGNRGAFDAGAPTVGLNITLPMEQYPNPYITPDLCFRFRYFALRKMHFIKRAKALVAFPGGYGTMDELFDALCLTQTRKITPMPIVLVGKEFWKGAFNPQFLADEGVIADEDLKLFSYAETAEEVWQIIRTFYGI